jgi:hypothetical protein
MQIFGFTGWGQWLMDAIHHPSLWLFPSLIFAAVVIFVWIHWWESQSLRDEFNKEWDDLDLDREVFRDALDDVFDRGQGAGSSSAHIKELVRRAKFPTDIFEVGSSLSSYTEKAIQRWEGDKKELLNLCIALCPLRKEDPILTGRDQQKFREVQKKLSKFWEKWGRRCFETGEMQFDDISSRLIDGETPYIVLLVYLEIAHARRTQEWASGKQGLFRIAEASIKKSNLM